MKKIKVLVSALFLLSTSNVFAMDFGQISSLLTTLNGQVSSFQGMVSEEALKNIQNAMQMIEETKKYVSMTESLVKNSQAISDSGSSNDIIKGIGSATDIAFEGLTDYFKNSDELNDNANRILKGLKEMNVVENIGSLTRLSENINDINSAYTKGLSDVARGMSTMRGDIKNVKELKEQLMSQVKSTENSAGKPENLAALLKALGQLLELNIDATNKVSTALATFANSDSVGKIKMELKEEENKQKSLAFAGNIEEELSGVIDDRKEKGWSGGFAQ